MIVIVGLGTGRHMRMPLAYSAAPALLMRAETWLTRACASSIAPSALSM